MVKTQQPNKEKKKGHNHNLRTITEQGQHRNNIGTQQGQHKSKTRTTKQCKQIKNNIGTT